jgi:DNA-binding NarL/FixJ family response regulator
VKILIVDDHHLIREGMRPVLKQLAPEGESAEVLEAASFQSALGVAGEHPDLDLVLLDLHLPDVTGFAALADLQERHPSLPVVVVSGEDDPQLVRMALDHGALGFIPKSSTSQVILNALRLVLSGGTYLPREVMSAPAAPAKPSELQNASAHKRLEALGITPRQADVLLLLLAGKSNKLICRELNLAEGTVKNHLAAVFKALNVASRVEAVIAAGKLGIKI